MLPRSWFWYLVKAQGEKSAISEELRASVSLLLEYVERNRLF